MIKLIVIVMVGLVALLILGSGLAQVLAAILGAIVGVAAALLSAVVGVFAGLIGVAMGLVTVLAVAGLPLAIIGLAIYGLVKLIQAV
jgi:hypothetical protein